MQNLNWDRIKALWNATLCSWISGSPCFKGLWCLHLHGHELTDHEDEGTKIL